MSTSWKTIVSRKMRKVSASPLGHLKLLHGKCYISDNFLNFDTKLVENILERCIYRNKQKKKEIDLLKVLHYSPPLNTLIYKYNKRWPIDSSSPCSEISSTTDRISSNTAVIAEHSLCSRYYVRRPYRKAVEFSTREEAFTLPSSPNFRGHRRHPPTHRFPAGARRYF